MKALIIDDELLSAKYLESLIKKYCFEIASTSIISSPIKAIEELNSRFYDIVFLDIEMPELSGFDVIQNITMDRNTHVIFTTAYSEYAVKAFQLNATDYLVKIIKAEELLLALKRVQERNSLQKYIRYRNTISIYYKDEHHILNLKDIIRLEADRSYTKFFLNDSIIMSSRGLSYYKVRLLSTSFIRCHKSHIVNIAYIKRLNKENNTATLINGEKIPISSSQLDFIINLKNSENKV